ncbi:hypothetical protein Cni_G07614 [Canna indica]|uniref:Uncharacterized protein n=1 Tax=Canna indica TaxID=4628 RepID=A0AAQ3Q7I3_9LILI|nr:hypothetical protein Cni_G07614 [Canna indica]
MGLCFSKKRQSSPQSSTTITIENKVEKPVEAATTDEKQPLFVSKKSHAAAAAVDDSKEKRCEAVAAAIFDNESQRCETSAKKTGKEVEVNCASDQVSAVEEFTPATFARTSSFTREEVDAILIQCGRLSRSSSANNASAEVGIGRRKYSGCKRSYDFDNERKGDGEEEEWAERPVSRPSPRRRTPSRERSGSRERTSGGRRVSRSPGRRSEVAASSGTSSDRSRQPIKMVAVPARDKGRGVSPSSSNKRGGETGAMTSSASPRSQSPANTSICNENASCHPQPQSLSWSSLRRNPMAEIDDNSLRANQNVSKDKVHKIKRGEEGMKKSSENSAQISKSITNNMATSCIREQSMSFRGTEQPVEPSVMGKTTENSSSKVLEALSVGKESHQQHPNTANSLPVCMSEACSISEAAADLNSTSSGNKNNDNSLDEWRGSIMKEPIVEPETHAKNNLWDPNLRKYVTPKSADSRNRSSRLNDGEEVEQEADQPFPEVTLESSETRGRRLRGGAVSSNSGGHSTTSSDNKRELHHRVGVREHQF